MIAHIHQALAQVQELRQRVLEKQRFKGYSGRARAASGTIALAAAAVMAAPRFPEKPGWHMIGWGTVFLAGVALNYGAMIYWFFFDPEIKRDLRRLKPVLDALPPLFVGSVLTAVFLVHDQHRFLFGTWMCLFGLANLASYHVLPRAIAFIGLYYVIAGTACLLSPRLSFTDPWPMGVIFFVGEWAGGLILHFDQATNASVDDLVRRLHGREDGHE